MDESAAYPARLSVEYPVQLDRLTTLVRIIWVIPIAIIASLVTASIGGRAVTEAGETIRTTGMNVITGLAMATALMIVFRQRYPRWWFDFARELTRFQARIGAYVTLLTDRYPSTVDEQAVHIEIDYPDVRRDLNRWLPLVKWLLVIPHLVVLVVLSVVAVCVVVAAWFAIIISGQYPRPLFDFVVGVGRYGLRTHAYAVLLVTDRYPPFSLT